MEVLDQTVGRAPDPVLAEHVERLLEPDVLPRLLPHLAHDRLVGLLARLDPAARQPQVPGRAVRAENSVSSSPRSLRTTA
ncbi:hypothetical protein GCM10025872_27830 [Barrientosiimonas endolithica]|uniref:Uncharacterized protein n=1 Tax=Barrientosiimonas endolithica TaxID=1535208 RepID=A0ABM8HDR8_9MICO|nr:hypothetical protein GCM10025872_27830 [Barrientosiimonas endolithica]